MSTTPDLLYQISLKLIPGIGDVLIKNLLAYCGSVEAVFKERRGALQAIPGIGSVLAENIFSYRNFEQAQKELAFIEKHHIQTYFYLDEAYPNRLRDIVDAPCLLYGLGNFDLNPPRLVGIVGTRRGTDYGRSFTQKLVQGLKDYNVTVVSGLAMGIDGIAHKACLENGVTNIGVLAHGLDRIYPSAHQGMAKKMLANGGLLSEFPSGTNPDRENFPKRNRIVAGLADVLVVPETAIKGGARITCEIAHSYNKDIMVLPGRVGDYYSQGCNYLIQCNKASMITCLDDLVQLMAWENKATKTKAPVDLLSQLDAGETKLVGHIRSKVKANLDEMAYELNMDPGTLALKLLELEFAGFVRSLPGKTFELS
ncbi:MAG: DNA-processing protein DprA [bacterium]|nr:DNA-processing protein DprA [bacterium]